MPDPRFGSNRLRSGFVIARQQPHVESHTAQFGHGSGGIGADAVGDGGDGDRMRPVGEPDDGPRPGGHTLRFAGDRGRDDDAVFVEQLPVPGQIHRRAGIPFDSAARQGFKAIDWNRVTVQSGSHGFGEGMLRKQFETVKQIAEGIRLFRPENIGQHGTALGQGSGLVQHHGIDLPGRFETLGVFYQNSQPCAPADADHDGSGRRQSQRAGTRHDQHGHEGQQAVRKAVGAAEHGPRRESQHGDGDNHGHEDRGDPVHQFLHRGLAALRLLHHADDMRQHGVGADSLGPETERSLTVDRPGEHLVSVPFRNRDGFAAQHALVHIGGAPDDCTVHGDPLPRFHCDHVARADLRQRHGTLYARRIDERNRIGLKSHQLADGRGGIVLGTRFEQPPQQDKGDDHARRFEIDVRLDAPRKPETGKQHVEKAEQIGGARADGHQRIHIGGTVAELPPRIDEKAPPQPKHHGRRKQPHGRSGIGRMLEEHGDNHNRHGERSGPERTDFQDAELLRALLFGQQSRIVAGIGHQVVSGLPHGIAERLGRTQRRIVLHGDRRRSVIDVRGPDARLTVQSFVHACGACGTAHTGDRKGVFYSFGCRHFAIF